MKAWVINKISDLTRENNPLEMIELGKPKPGRGEILIKVSVCGICHTEIDEIEGRIPNLQYPRVPGHQIVGDVEETGTGVESFIPGDRVGVAWIYFACGKCSYCLSGKENLCPEFKATGKDVNGGYAEYVVVHEKFAYKIPEAFTDIEAAPLLCAGAIGYRSLALCNLINGQRLGLTGFGASAHLVLKLVKHICPQSEVFVFARSTKEREFAIELGCVWAGDTIDNPPDKLDCIIDTTPVWKPIVHALNCLKPGGRLVINAIRKENHDRDYLLNLEYPEHLWMEKEIKSVANITSYDVREFLRIAAEIPIKPKVEVFPFEEANKALVEIRQGKIKGAKVLEINPSTN